MSTKIYNGYYSNLNIADLLQRFKALVPEFTKLKLHGYTKHLVSKTIEQIDRMHQKGESEIKQNDILYKKYDKHVDKVKETISKGMREPDLDFHAYCCVFPVSKEYRVENIHSPADLETLILFYCDDCKEMINLFRDQGFIFDYHYQNSTDKPKDITEKNWEQRIKDWDHVLEDDVALFKGYRFTFSTEQLPWYRKIWLLSHDYIITKQRRADILLRDEFVGKKIKEINAKKNKSEEEFNMSDYFDALDEWAVYKETPEYEVKINEIIPTLLEIDFSPPIKEE